MNDRSEILMLSGILRPCTDCLDDRIFVPINDCDSDGCDFCCATCGAAVTIDPVCDYAVLTSRVA